MHKCTKCGSYAINHHLHGRDGSDVDLCDVCFWQKRAPEAASAGGSSPIPENILRAADAIAAYPEAYKGYALILAEYIRSNWPSLPARVPPGPPEEGLDLPPLEAWIGLDDDGGIAFTSLEEPGPSSFHIHHMRQVVAAPSPRGVDLEALLSMVNRTIEDGDKHGASAWRNGLGFIKRSIEARASSPLGGPAEAKILSHMRRENEARKKMGLPPIGPIEAADQLRGSCLGEEGKENA